MSNPIVARDIQARAVEWLWERRIPRGMISVVAGKPDQGKGLFSARVAADVTKRGGRVLYSAIEDDHGLMTKPRLLAAGADLEKVYLWRFQVPSHINELRAYVERNKIDLVVMDPFNAHLSSGVSRFSDNVRKATTPLSELAEKTGCAILITEHALKKVSKNAHPLTAIGGSGSGLPAAARMAFIFGVNPDDGDSRILACVKHNITQKPQSLQFEVDVDEQEVSGDQPYLVAKGETEFDAMRLLVIEKDGSVTGGRPADKRAAAAEWLTNHIWTAGSPVKAGQVLEDAKQVGLTAKTVRRAAEDMGIVKNPPGGGKGCTWDLPQPVKDILAKANAPSGPTQVAARLVGNGGTP